MTHPDYWPSCGLALLSVNHQGHLTVTDDFLRALLERPELAPIAQSCTQERALHERLLAHPRSDIAQADLAAMKDRDAAENYAIWARFRQRLLAKPTLEASYLDLFQGQGVDVPPLLVQQLTQVLLRHILGTTATALQVRVAEMLFRVQSISVQDDGSVMAADRETVDRFATTGGFGTLGELLQQGGASLRTVDLDVLRADNADAYWARSESFDWVVCMNRGEPALDALCTVLRQWIGHFWGVSVRIQTVTDIDDAQWVWHTGLDAQSSAILNALYQGQDVPPEHLARMMCLFQLDFDAPQDMRADLQGKPVYLGMAVDAHKCLQLKPQNLLINLPLAQRS
jgi:Family of unknown function (DUF6352)